MSVESKASVLAMSCLVCIAGTPQVSAQSTAAAADAIEAKHGFVYAATLQGSDVVEIDPTGTQAVIAFVPSGSGGLSGGTGIAFGPDGDLYVASSQTHQVLRFDGETGRPKGVFATDSLSQPFSILFGPDGDLYVSSGARHEVLRYDGASGDFVGVVGSDLRVPIGLRFGPDGRLFVANAGAGEIVAFGPAGEREVFVSGGLEFPSDLIFSDDGSLYVSSALSGEVVEYDADTGERRRVLVALEAGSAPVGLAFSLDGALIVADFGAGRILSVDRDGGAYSVIATGLGGPENVVVRGAATGGRAAGAAREGGR